MTRYSRQVMPGRGAADSPDAALDRMVFGAKRKAAPSVANDVDEPDFLPAMEDDEADMLVSRSNGDRRKGVQDRRRAPSGRRTSEYVPLREGGVRTPDESRRGPLLLVGALLIVVVFAVVVWNAYRDGVQGEVETPPELSTSGAFKTPPRAVVDVPIVTEPAEAAAAPKEETLAGAPTDALNEVRAAPAPAPVEPSAPPPSKVTAPPPAPLKAPTPAVAAPTQTATAQPAATQPAAPKPPAAAPVPVAPKPAVSGVAPAFAASGAHVVQLAATSSEASANAEWTRLSKAHPDLLSGAERFVVQADVNGKTVYRLRVGSFGSKADAVAFCTAFKAQGGNCLPATK